MEKAGLLFLAGFASIAELVQARETFETWSQFVLAELER